jgi:hypothetical protein
LDVAGKNKYTNINGVSSLTPPLSFEKALAKRNQSSEESLKSIILNSSSRARNFTEVIFSTYRPTLEVFRNWSKSQGNSTLKVIFQSISLSIFILANHVDHLPDLSVDPPVKLDPGLRQRILLSCHATLIRLGDLSRYRETEIITGKGRNWGPAIGYYDLAGIIHPASGASHNQLAVIALADGNHLRATYHLYRALSAQEPHPTSKGNLEIELRKILSAWAKRELIPQEDAGIPGKALTPWFVYLHAQCYKGLDFAEHDELENEVLSQLAVDLKERSLEGTLQKFVLINIAAEDFARIRSSNGKWFQSPGFKFSVSWAIS